MSEPYRGKRAFDLLAAGAACVVFAPLGRGVAASRRLDRLYLRRQDPMLDLQLVALSFAVNLVGKHRLRRLMRST